MWRFSKNRQIHPATQRKTAQKSPHQASDIAKLWLCVLSVLVLRASIGCAVVPQNPAKRQRFFKKRKTVQNSTDFRGGWIRLIAQGCTCANCPSVSTERWFGAHSARRFEKPPIHPLGKQKSTSRDTFFVVRGGFAQQRACKFTCQSEVCTPKGGSTREACGCLKTA